MSESKQTIPVNGQASGSEQPAEHGSATEHVPASEHAPVGEQPQTPGAAAPGGEAGHADGAARLQGDLDELGQLAAKRDEYLALAQRTQADFENYRKRVARESQVAHERGVAKLAKELLPAIDNLDRALGAAANDDPLLDGVRLVRSELSAGLARVGVEAFSPLGEPFDPSVHEAMASVPQPPEGGAASGTVVEVYQDGYRLGDTVIRPARVVVAA
jgi:molecular chaperone GrpE